MPKAYPHALAMEPATLIKRYKRFLADVRLPDGSEMTVLCPNTGSMKACSDPERPIMISNSGNEKRKYLHTFEMIQMGRTWVNVNTNLPNKLVGQAIADGVFPSLKGYAAQKAEVKYGKEGKSRIDWFLSEHADSPNCFVEIKNTTFRVGDACAFPDAVTTRGQKHLRELIEVVEQGKRGVIFFFVGRNDCQTFRPCDEIDPEYGKLLRQAVDAGVEALAWRFRFSPKDVTPIKELEIVL